MVAELGTNSNVQSVASLPCIYPQWNEQLPAIRGTVFLSSDGFEPPCIWCLRKWRENEWKQPFRRRSLFHTVSAQLQSHQKGPCSRKNLGVVPCFNVQPYLVSCQAAHRWPCMTLPRSNKVKMVNQGGPDRDEWPNNLIQLSKLNICIRLQMYIYIYLPNKSIHPDIWLYNNYKYYTCYVWMTLLGLFPPSKSKF